MNLQLIFSDREMEEFLVKLGYEVKLESEVDGVVSNTPITPKDGFFRQVEKRKYAYKDEGGKGRLESIFWLELKKKLLSL